MGPGYFPTVLGGLLVAIGAACAIRSLRSGGAPGASREPPSTPVAWQPLLHVATALVLFGLLVRRGGLVAALLVAVLLSARASSRFRWGASLSLAIGLAVFAVLVFALALGLPIPILGSGLGG
jgi:hypothetical protein